MMNESAAKDFSYTKTDTGADITNQPDAPAKVRRVEFPYIPAGPKRLNLKLIDQDAEYYGSEYKSLPASYRQSGEYSVPLARALPTHNKDEKKSTAFPIITPVYPVRLGPANEQNKGDELVPLRKGRIYLFKNGHLWRELELINEQAGTLAEVNLTEYQGKNQRPASVRHGCSILLPYQDAENGNPNKIQACYSETPWSWLWIKRLGGMDVNDPRYIPERHQSYQDVPVSNKLRDERLQTINLTPWRQKSQPDMLNDHVVDIADAAMHSGLSHLAVQAFTEAAVLVFRDPVGIARELALDYQAAWVGMDELVREATGTVPDHIKSLNADDFDSVMSFKEHGEYLAAMRQQESWSQSAQMLQHYFFSREEQSIDPSLDEDEREEQEEAIEQWKDWRKLISLEKLEKTLLKEDRHRQREIIKETKARLVEFIDETSSPWNFTIAMQDQVMLESSRIQIPYITLNRILARITDTPSQLDNYLDAKPKKLRAERALDPGNDLALRLMAIHPEKKQHPLASCLFARPTDTSSNKIDDIKTDIPNRYDLVFQPDKFIRSSNSDDIALNDAIAHMLNHLQKAEHIKLGNKQFEDLVPPTLKSLVGKITSTWFNGKNEYTNSGASKEQTAIHKAADTHAQALRQQQALLEQQKKVLAAEQEKLVTLRSELQQHRARQQAAEGKLIQARFHLNEARIAQDNPAIKYWQTQINKAEIKHSETGKQVELARKRLNTQLDHINGTRALLSAHANNGAQPKGHTPKISPQTVFGRLLLLIGRYPIAALKLPAIASVIGLTPEGTASLRAQHIKNRVKSEQQRITALKNNPGQKIAMAENGKAAGFADMNELRLFQGDWLARESLTQLTDADIEKVVNGKKIPVFVALQKPLPEAETAAQRLADYRKAVKAIENTAQVQRGARVAYGKLLRQALKSADFARGQLVRLPVPRWLQPEKLQAGAARYCLLTVLTGFELSNLKNVWRSWLATDEFLNKESTRVLSSFTDITALTGQWAEYARYALYGWNQEEASKLAKMVHDAKMKGGLAAQKQVINKFNAAQRNTWKTLKFSRFALRFNLAAQYVSLQNTVLDIVGSIDAGDYDKAVAEGALAINTAVAIYAGHLALSGFLTGSGVAAWVGPVGWATFAIAIALTFIIRWLTDDRMTAWLIHSPWGEESYGGDHDYWQSRPGLMTIELMDLLFRPQINFAKRTPRSKDPYIYLDIKFPYFGPKSALELDWAHGNPEKGLRSNGWRWNPDTEQLGSWNPEMAPYTRHDVKRSKDGRITAIRYRFDISKLIGPHYLSATARFYPHGVKTLIAGEEIILPEPSRREDGTIKNHKEARIETDTGPWWYGTPVTHNYINNSHATDAIRNQPGVTIHRLKLSTPTGRSYEVNEYRFNKKPFMRVRIRPRSKTEGLYALVDLNGDGHFSYWRAGPLRVLPAWVRHSKPKNNKEVF